MAQRRQPGIPIPVGMPRPTRTPRQYTNPCSNEPGTNYNVPVSNIPQAARRNPPASYSITPSDTRPQHHIPHHPNPSKLKPPTAGPRSLSVPRTNSRSNTTTASRSGGHIPTKKSQMAQPQASNTIKSFTHQSFAPQFTSSRTALPTSYSKPSVTGSGVGGQKPRTKPQNSSTYLSSTMISSRDQSFKPKLTSSRIIAEPRSIRFRPTGDISRVPSEDGPVYNNYSRDTSRLMRRGQCPGVTRTSNTSVRPPTQIETLVTTSIMDKSQLRPGEKVSARRKIINQRPAETTFTPAGRESVLQKSVLEKKVERNQEGEKIIKNVAMSNLDECTGMMNNVEIGIQELDPRYYRMEGKEVVGVTSAISVTPKYTTISKDYVRTVTDSTQVEIGMSLEEVARLVEDEKEDVNNTLRMIPPDLILEPGKYVMKHRLQQMRLNTESVALLEQSIIRPDIAADEVHEELSPETLAAVMYTIETGIKPESSPDQVFNSLFQDQPSEHFINVSSVTPGPLQEVVVPIEIPKDIHKEVVSVEMTKLADMIVNANSQDIPNTDIFSRVMEDLQKKPEKGKNNPRSFQMIQDERSLWVNANLEPLVNIVGAEPVDVLDPLNLNELEKSGNLQTELINGVEYFVETNPVQYMNRVQLRGSQMPSYFPGYFVAVSELPDIVKIVRSPDEVFALAWKSVQPKYFEEEAIMSLME